MNMTAAAENIDISLIKNQLRQLKDLHDAGSLTEQAYTEARNALERRLLDWVLRDTPAEPGVEPTVQVVATPKAQYADVAPEAALPIGSSKSTLAAVAAVLVLVAVGGAYFFVNRTPDRPVSAMAGSTFSMSSSTAEMTASKPAPHTTNAGDISVMADKLAARLKKQPDDAQGWSMLARSYDVLGNLPDALKAYEKAVALAPNDAPLLADYAAAVAKASQNSSASMSGMVMPPLDKAQVPAAGASVIGTPKP